MKIGPYTLDLKNQFYIMGILNMTPDSFSDGASYANLDAALYRVEQMIKEGAAIIDIGGESTRPGHVPVSVREEIDRVAPVIAAVKEHFPVPISVDTYKAEVATAAFEAGAHMLNDIWGLMFDEGEMARLVASRKEEDVAVCLMHNKKDPHYTDLMEDLLTDLKASVKRATDAGIPGEQLILDPGIGFAKTTKENLVVMNHLERLNELGLPVLLGTSRKSMIGNTLQLPVDERLEGTLATTVMGIMKGATVIRVHDIKENYRAAKMTWEILHSED